MAEVFPDMQALIPEKCRTKKMVFHCSLNPHPDDKISDEQLVQVAREYMEALGYGNQPYIVFKHSDIAREHIHIVSLRVDSRGQKINDKFEKRRSKQITDALERKFGLIPSSKLTEKAVAEIVERFGRIDVLINNAALDHPGTIEELTVGQWNEIIGVNLNGVFHGCKAVYPIMKEQGKGFIITISSVAGKRGWPKATAYCASKFALTGFSQALGSEGREHNIRCCVVYPGGIDTDWHEERNAAFMQPEELGKFLENLASLPPNLVPNEVVVTPLVERGYP